MAEYYLDLVTMIAALQSLRQTGRIEADLPTASARGKGSIQAGHLTLLVKDGQILSWAIVNLNGEQSSSSREVNMSTLQKLYPMRIKWTFTPMTPPTQGSPGVPFQFSPARNQGTDHGRGAPFTSTPLPQPHASSSNAGSTRIPHRTRFLSTEELATVPRDYRMIYALVNGINSIERITQLMPGMSSDRIEMFLHELQARGIIAW
jgi:hypothetical protein